MSVVLSRIQNRKGTLVEFEDLYAPLSDPSLQLLPGELGLAFDESTGEYRLFIGGLTSGTYTEIAIDGNPTTLDSTLNISPLVVYLAPSAIWSPVTSLWYTPSISNSNTCLLNILYGVVEQELTPVPMSTTPFTKSGQLSITTTPVRSGDSFTPVSILTDTGTEINQYPDPQPDISFRATYSGGTVQVEYKHDFPGLVQLSTSTIKWATF